MTPVRVLLVDDATHVRAELRTVLCLSGKVEIVGEAGNGLEAVEAARRLRPDVVLMDLEMPVMDGHEAARQVKDDWPSCRVVALTIHDEPLERSRAAKAGIDAFVVKGSPLEIMLKAIIGEVRPAPGGHS
jgi:DNA-binding NarL/FixJ family response regulator